MAVPAIMDALMMLGGVGATTAGAWGFLVEPRIVKERQIRLESARWPGHCRDLRIAVLGDFQVGAPWFKIKHLDRVVQRVNAMEPDIVVLLGDYVIEGVLFGRFVQPPEIARSLSRLTARHGVYSVLGNHDWWHDGEEIRRELEAAGIRVLENEAAPIDLPEARIWIAGLADESTREPCMTTTFGPIPVGEPVIALAHDPLTFFDIPDQAVVTFAGHTHGGQVCLPGGYPIVTHSLAEKRFAAGHWTLGGMKGYTSRGAGVSGLPVRFNCRGEVTIFTLRSAQEEFQPAA